MGEIADGIPWSDNIRASLAAQIGLALPRIPHPGPGSAGTVIGINLRYTVLDAGDGRVLVPNGTLFSNTVTVERLGAEPPGRG